VKHAPYQPGIDRPRHLIGGAWLVPTGECWLDVVDPATGQLTGVLPIGTRLEVDKAVRAAASAFDGGWCDTSLVSRIALLERVTEAVASRREQFAQVICREIGTPITFARAHQVDAAVRHLQATLDAARTEVGQIEVGERSPSADRVVYEPMGVAALITPWNWPLNQVVLKVAGALAAGCTMVLKPSESSTMTALLFAECLQEAGVPPGVFNVVVGDGPETGAGLCAHPGVRAISFTGSTATGHAIAHAAVADMKRVTLELGGKSANIIFADCDLPTAIRQGVAHCFRNAGQSCNAASRMLVDRRVYDQAVALAAGLADGIRCGHPAMDGDHMGPLVSLRQFERVQGYIASGIGEGARLVAGGLGNPVAGEGGLTEAGFYCRPTVFADVTAHMTIFNEEIFGPVLTMTPFDSEEEAITLANATRYGLAAFIQTRDPVRAVRVSRRLKVGMIQINGASRVAGAPFGGVKQSGIGREAGLWGVRAFQEIKSISGIPGAAL
jgi:aldehyde dehydrogenase (NAD+)